MLMPGDTATSVYGLLARPYPFGATTDPLGNDTPPDDGVVDVLRKGYMTVKLSGDDPAAKGNPVYIWTAPPSGTHIFGGYEATDPGNDLEDNPQGFQLPMAVFMGPADTNNNVEINLLLGP
jgi:hypothetical protein